MTDWSTLAGAHPVDLHGQRVGVLLPMAREFPSEPEPFAWICSGCDTTGVHQRTFDTALDELLAHRRRHHRS